LHLLNRRFLVPSFRIGNKIRLNPKTPRKRVYVKSLGSERWAHAFSDQRPAVAG
jgi:hypothetical protein